MATIVRNDGISEEKKGNIDEGKQSRPRSILPSILGLFLWLISFADLAFHTSRDPVIFGKYSLQLFGAVIVVGLGSLIWIWSIFSPKPAQLVGVLLSLFKESVFHGVMVVSLCTFFIWFFGRWTKFEDFRLIQIAAIGYCIGGIIAILFPLAGKGRIWRMIATLFFVAIIATEIVLQVMSYTGNLDLNTYRGLSAPYGRILLNESGSANTLTNRHGWYAPPFTTDSDNERIVLIGDGFIEGTQVSIPETIGVQLDTIMDADVMAMGTAGFGPAQYYETTLSALNHYNPDKIVIAVNFGDDFLNVLQDEDPRRAQDHIFYNILDDGTIEIEENSLIAQHFTDHYLNNSTLPLWDTAIHTVRSHLLIPKVTEPARNFAKRTELQEAVSRERWAEVDADYALRGFIFDETESELTSQSTTILGSLLAQSKEIAVEQGVEVILVGIPSADTAVNAQIPSDILAEIAATNKVDYFSLEADPALYTGTHGHWNAEGHRFYAERIAGCLQDGVCSGQ